MKKSSKQIKELKFAFANKKKKIGLSYWRFFFVGVNSITGTEQMFFIELEMLNPWLKPSETSLSFKPRVTITADDLQYALAGTQAARSIETEELNLPSYCAVRVGKMGASAKQLCYYFPIKDMEFHPKPFEIQIGNKFFSEDKISGFLNLSKEDVAAHPEYLCDSGTASWDLHYEAAAENREGFSSKDSRWFPFGLKTEFSGEIKFDGVDYIVNPKKSFGYVEWFWGKTMPDPWFHLSAEHLTSEISGKTLFKSSFSIQGVFDDNLSCIGNFEDIRIQFCADRKSKSYSAVWDCIQMPEAENIDENLLHWSASFHNKLWVLDVDVYCRIKDLFNRLIELPDNTRRVMSILEGATGTGEVKLYRRRGNSLEQIEQAKLTKVLCEFGHIEQSDFQ